MASVKYGRAGDLSVGEASVGEAAWDWVRTPPAHGLQYLPCLVRCHSDRGVKGQWDLLVSILASDEGSCGPGTAVASRRNG